MLIITDHIGTRLNDEFNIVLTVEAELNRVNQFFLQTSSCWCSISLTFQIYPWPEKMSIYRLEIQRKDMIPLHRQYFSITAQ